MNRESAVLALNCGSSSLKFSLYVCAGDKLSLFCEGEVEEIGNPEASFWIQTTGQERQERKTTIRNHEGAFALTWDELDKNESPTPYAIGHRIVHGGPLIRDHQRLTPEISRNLERAADFAPLHVPAALAVLHASELHCPDTVQVICLDTAFHRTLPDVSRTLPLPANLRAEGVERYGFHGLSLESIMAQLDEVPARLVIAHLGNGCSITAVQEGKSVDTTMAMTPNAGLMMGTRCGSIDPGIATYLANHHAASADDIDDIFNRKSGLLGVSDLSSDVRELSSARHSNAQADLALRMFCQQVKKQCAAMAAVLGGIDELVFTGGIGEHAADLREQIIRGLDFLGDFKKLTLPAQEDLQIARITARLAGLTADAAQ
jgi:acetate kinase